MQRAIDMTDKKFGRLTVIKRNGSDKWKQALWLCKCSCGTEKIIQGHRLREGKTKSCGCLKTELIRMNPGIANMRRLISGYKKDAKRRELKWNLTEEQFAELTQKNCYYCGAKPNNVGKSKTCNGDYIYNGLDRIDNTKGYTINNVVPCCKICNRAKSDLALQEFQNWIIGLILYKERGEHE